MCPHKCYREISLISVRIWWSLQRHTLCSECSLFFRFGTVCICERDFGRNFPECRCVSQNILVRIALSTLSSQKNKNLSFVLAHVYLMTWLAKCLVISLVFFTPLITHFVNTKTKSSYVCMTSSTIAGESDLTPCIPKVIKLFALAMKLTVVPNCTYIEIKPIIINILKCEILFDSCPSVINHTCVWRHVCAGRLRVQSF